MNFPAHFKIIISTNLLKLPNRYQQPIISHWKHPHKRGSQPVFKQQTSNSPKTIIMDKTKELINVAGSKFLFKASLGLNTVQETLQVVDQMGTPNFQISAGLTLLHLAVQYNRTDLVKALLERGADTEVKTDYGETPLDQAAWKGYDESAILLLKHGANVNCATNLGYTPLHRF